MTICRAPWRKRRKAYARTILGGIKLLLLVALWKIVLELIGR